MADIRSSVHACMCVCVSVCVFVLQKDVTAYSGAFSRSHKEIALNMTNTSATLVSHVIVVAQTIRPIKNTI